jgi:hypothetical protein
MINRTPTRENTGNYDTGRSNSDVSSVALQSVHRSEPRLSKVFTATNIQNYLQKKLVRNDKKTPNLLYLRGAVNTESHADSSLLHTNHYISIAGGTSREVQYLPQSCTVKPSGFSILPTHTDFITSKYCGL